MSEQRKGTRLQPWSPATYEIVVEGLLEESWADGFGGMTISTRKRSDQSIVTSLTGRVMDQSHLAGLLDALAELHLPILAVTNIQEGRAGD